MEAPAGWLHRVAFNAANSHYRRRRTAQALLDGCAATTSRCGAGRPPGPARRAAALPARDREVMVLRYYLGHTHPEIAALLGLPEGSVRSIAHRAGAQLARLLPGYAPEVTS